MPRSRTPGWLKYSPVARTRAPTKMADLLVATTTLENKKGEKVNASEALKGKVVALYVRLTLSRTTSPAVAAAPAPAESASPCARQLTCSRSAAGSSPRTGARPAAVRSTLELCRDGAVLCARLTRAAALSRCAGFTPQLAAAYEMANEDEKRFEVVFVSSDESAQAQPLGAMHGSCMVRAWRHRP